MFDLTNYSDFYETEVVELGAELESTAGMEFPFQTKKVKGEERRVYSNNEELRSWLNCGLQEGSLRFPDDRRGHGEVIACAEAHAVCDVLMGALRGVLTEGDNTRAMEPAKAWSLLRTLTKVDRESVRRHGDAKHTATEGHVLSDAAVDFQVKSLRAAGAALWELKTRGWQLREEAAESHTDGKELVVWSKPTEDGEVFPLRVIDWAEVRAEDAKKRAEWEAAMPPATPEHVKLLPVKVPRMTVSQVKRATSAKAKEQREKQARLKASRKVGKGSYSVPAWLDKYDREMHLVRGFLRGSVGMAARGRPKLATKFSGVSI